MIKSRITYLLFLVLLILVAPTVAMAEAIGTWKLYPCYSDVKEIVPAGDDVFVLAGGNLYSYNVTDNALTEYTKITCLSSSDITHIAWVQQAKRLIITYSDYTIDFLSLNQDVTTIADLANKQMTGDKTINDIYVNGKYAYIATGFGIMKVNVGEEYIADTYNLGYNVDYCYIEGSYIYAESSTQGNMRALLTSNLLDKNNWTRVGNYTEKQKDTYTQDTHNNCYWAADSDSKLIRYQKQDDGSYLAVSTGVKPDGPVNNRFWRLYKHDGKVFCTAGCHAYGVSADTYKKPGIVHVFANGTWSKLNTPDASLQTTVYQDANCMAFDPKDKNHYWVGAYSGLYEYKDGVAVKVYNISNSTLTAMHNKDTAHANVTTMTYDNNGNLWVMTGWSDPFINCLSTDGTWTAYPHSEYTYENRYSIDHEGAFISKTNGKMWWINDYYNASALYQYDYTNDKLIGHIPVINQDNATLEITRIHNTTEDNSGNVWIASDSGPFYLSKEDISSGNEVLTQYKVPRNDGTNYADYLLANVAILCIKVDGANRKWMGTSADGVYVISADNNTQVYHFTTENSPLPSNTIYDILVDSETGVVFIATDNGLCSFVSDVTEGNSSNEGMIKESVYAYPNPVTPEYSGKITIVGLVDGAQIKILTSSGQLVHEGITNGGSYQWNGYDLNGNKVASGVYMVCVATAEGNKGVVTKIGIVR